MVRPLRRFRSSAILLPALVLACEGDPYARKAPAAGAAQGAEGGVAGAAAGSDPAAGTKAKAKADAQPLGKILPGAPLPLAQILGQEPAKAESFLGPPLPGSKGGMRDKCVRYLPERTWFRCRHAWQRYSDQTGTFGVVQLTFEDGTVTGIAFEEIPGSGDFDPRKALAAVGLDLPGEPRVESPQEGVTLWVWWNSRARLRVHGREYFVRVSSVDGGWDRAKVELVLNDHLTDDEKARVIADG